MNDDSLFTVPETKPPRLVAARIRLSDAQKAYDEAVASDEENDGFGIVPSEIKDEVAAARYELARAEDEELRARKTP